MSIRLVGQLSSQTFHYAFTSWKLIVHMWHRMTQRIKPLASGVHIDVTQKENIRLTLSLSEAVDGYEKSITIVNKNSRTVQKHNILPWESNEFSIWNRFKCKIDDHRNTFTMLLV